MSIIRGKVRVGKLYRGCIKVGSPTELIFRNGKILDKNGNELKTRPLGCINLEEDVSNLTLREQAEIECSKILSPKYYEALGNLPSRLNAAIIELFLDNKDNDIIRRAYVKLHNEGSL